MQTVLLVTAHWLFFFPAEAVGLPALFAASIRQSFTALAALLHASRPLRLDASSPIA